ncbi:major facilitator superfamily domain-containing protein [Aspergillus sergii]|uniref:Major facilitator superfamily domain-containing protein n=1 Tax=Aspergillus sergii TaxID=1034303 RepID=A0A5N6X6R2_9EURO|nr:major facilitator superfamily domain-containing protein [Aspergillus sergii]
MGEEKKHSDTVAHAIPTHRVDDAVEYLEGHAGVANTQDVDISALRRKIDYRIIPFMFCCYVLQFLDKVMLNYAAVMGLKKDLGLVGNDFSNTATWFFIAYLIAEVPNVYLLQKTPAAKWLGLNVTLWGVAAAASAGAHDYRSLLVSRIFLGIFEATIGPSLMLLSSQFYTRSEQAPRFTFWYLGLGVAQIIGGIISFGFQQVHHSFAGWRIMFLVLGLVTMLVGVLTMFFIPDTPMKARWLSEREKVALLRHVSVNQTGVWSSRIDMRQIWEAVGDVQLWLLTLTTICTSVSSGVVTTYSATLINGFGFTPPHSALLNTPSGIVSIFFTLVVGIGIRRISHRWAWFIFCTIPGITGGALMSFLPKHNKAGVLIGIYLVNAIVATLPILYQWTMANCAGHTKRAFSSALVAGSFSVGNIIGPQTFQARDAPEYRPAKIAVLATQAAAGTLAFVLFLYYAWENRRRAKAAGAGEEEVIDETKWAGLTDKENQWFRYVY